MSATAGKSGSKFSGFTSEMKTMITENEQSTQAPEIKTEPVKVISAPEKKVEEAKPERKIKAKTEKKKIILAIPEEYYEQAQIGALMRYKGNITAYINSLIKKDIEENAAKYKEFEIITRN